MREVRTAPWLAPPEDEALFQIDGCVDRGWVRGDILKGIPRVIGTCWEWIFRSKSILRTEHHDIMIFHDLPRENSHRASLTRHPASTVEEDYRRLTFTLGRRGSGGGVEEK